MLNMGFYEGEKSKEFNKHMTLARRKWIGTNIECSFARKERCVVKDVDSGLRAVVFCSEILEKNQCPLYRKSRVLTE